MNIQCIPRKGIRGFSFLCPIASHKNPSFSKNSVIEYCHGYFIFHAAYQSMTDSEIPEGIATISESATFISWIIRQCLLCSSPLSGRSVSNLTWLMLKSSLLLDWPMPGKPLHRATYQMHFSIKTVDAYFARNVASREMTPFKRRR